MLILGQCSPSLPCLGCNLIGTVTCYFLLSLSAHSRSDLSTPPPSPQHSNHAFFFNPSLPHLLQEPSLYPPFLEAMLFCTRLYHRPPPPQHTFSLKFSGHSWVESEREVLTVFFSLLLACSLKAPPPPLLCVGQRLQLKLCKPGLPSSLILGTLGMLGAEMSGLSLCIYSRKRSCWYRDSFSPKAHSCPRFFLLPLSSRERTLLVQDFLCGHIRSFPQMGHLQTCF